MKNRLSNLPGVLANHLVIHYIIIPIFAPLFLAGMTFAICAVSLARKESVYPSTPPWGLHEPFATVALALICVVVPLPYFAFIFRMNADATVLGYGRQFWRVLVPATLIAAVLLVIVFVGLI